MEYFFNLIWRIILQGISQMWFYFLFFLLTISFQSSAQGLEYPLTASDPTVKDTLFDKIIYDEYRWLEGMETPQVKDWIKEQNALTNKELKKYERKVSTESELLKYLYSVAEAPAKDGKYYISLYINGNIGNPSIFIRSSLTENPQLLVDPNFISLKDQIRIVSFEVSNDSKFLAYSFSRNGGDFEEVNVVSIKTGFHKSDHLKDVKGSKLVWRGDGFYYSKMPNNGFDVSLGQEVYYHQLGTEQAEDKLIFKRSKSPKNLFNYIVSNDERYFILSEYDETNHEYNYFYIDFQSEIKSLRPFLLKLKGNESLSFLEVKGNDLIAFSYKDAPNGMIVKLGLDSSYTWKVIIPALKEGLLQNVKLLKEHIVCQYRFNNKEFVTIYNWEGKELVTYTMPFGFSVSKIEGEWSDKELLLSYEGYTQPAAVIRLLLDSLEFIPWQSTDVYFDYKVFEGKEIKVKASDGTSIPVYLFYKKGIDLKGNNPLLLKTYGGFGVYERPNFDPGIVYLLDQNIVYAFADVRGGGNQGLQYGRSGRGFNKPNSFQDFIETAQFLVDSHYTSPEKLAITGGSNGGLMVGVAMTKRPDLFKAAIPIVGPMDMLHYEKFSVGKLLESEYGSVSTPKGLASLMSFDPLSNIKDDVNYPSTLIMTSENDERVPPCHSYKFAAKLQNRASQINPILLRVERKAGHFGANKGWYSYLDEMSDMFDFIIGQIKK